MIFLCLLRLFVAISSLEFQILLYGKYTFICELEKEAILPYYKGSTFRGVFGIALKKVVCALKRQECEDCLLKNRCLYVRVFETPLALKMPEGSKISTPPHPFVIEPPRDEKMEFEAGDTVCCDLLLFGEANSSIPYFIYAFDQMGKIGIGKRINGKRGRFVLKEVKKEKKTIYSDKDQKLDLSDSAQDLNLLEPGVFPTKRTIVRRGKKIERPLPEDGDIKDPEIRIRVTLKTPLRMKFDNKIHADLPFHVLARAMLRRVSSLLNTWGDGEPDLDYRGLVERATGVRNIDNSLRWFDWKRYSNRQERKMFMGGMMGSVTYEGKLNEYLPLLDFCEKVHLGKNTSFGLGKIKVQKVH